MALNTRTEEDSALWDNGSSSATSDDSDTKCDKNTIAKSRRCCKYGCSAWCRKYFWEGQLKESKEEPQNEMDKMLQYNCWMNFFKKHRRLIGLTFPILLFHAFWWGVVAKHNLWNYFSDKWFMSVTMAFGSIVAGMTTEGGGAIAFPVMTLAFKIEPSVARDFSIMIQSCGMIAAAITIFIMRIKLEWNSLLWCTIGGSAGTIYGLEMIDPYLTAGQKKMGFVSIWFSFAFALFLLNRYQKRQTFCAIPYVSIWKVAVLIVVGFVGGVTTAFSGSGLDICSFSILTLLFRVSEKVATPTSVILMAGNSLVGFYWRGVMMQGISAEAWEFFIVCIPIVVIGAPLGSVVGSHFHRLVLAAMIYFIDTVALIGAFILVPQTPTLIGMSVGIIIFGFIFFLVLTKFGDMMLKKRNLMLQSNVLTSDLENCLFKKIPSKDDCRENSENIVK